MEFITTFFTLFFIGIIGTVLLGIVSLLSIKLVVSFAEDSRPYFLLTVWSILFYEAYKLSESGGLFNV